MTPVDKVFMLEASTKLTFDAMLEIYKSGYTRIPVYDGTVSKDRVISVLYVKDLILVDPDDEIEVQTVVSFRCSLPPNPPPKTDSWCSWMLRLCRVSQLIHPRS